MLLECAAGCASTVCICGAHSQPHQQAEGGDLWGGCDGHGGGSGGQLPWQGPLLLSCPWPTGMLPCDVCMTCQTHKVTCLTEASHTANCTCKEVNESLCFDGLYNWNVSREPIDFFLLIRRGCWWSCVSCVPRHSCRPITSTPRQYVITHIIDTGPRPVILADAVAAC